jgi:hypothetical protein
VAAAQSGGLVLRFIANIGRPQGLEVGDEGPAAARDLLGSGPRSLPDELLAMLIMLMYAYVFPGS